MKNKTHSVRKRKLIAIIFGVLAIVFGVILFLKVDAPHHLGEYFTKAYYGQFGAIAICVELLAAAYYLFIGHKKTNFAMALFAFTVALNGILNLLGLGTSSIPIFIMLVFLVSGGIAFYIAFSNAFNSGKILIRNVIFSFVLGNIIAFYFNYF
ncbi:hypothetical protein DFQ03_0624 [Maribacter caenipelagi]|uniref:DoxX-like protein n=1 Tax=Maribacter caenipelagi TaxID=1447781 RepID=A0A4R7DEV1_9FLAO|nr:hypothetical protein [Maribacter caenipelagi]TDS18911.1 hypothetical protein DFQ03_0624 [Maribacter caenipelagi]